MQKVYPIQVNLKAKNNYVENILVSNDNSNKLQITLVEDYEPVDLNGLTATLFVKDPNGQVFDESSNTKIVDSKIETFVSVGTMTTSGRYKAQIKLVEATQRIRSTEFYFDVELALDDAGSIVPSNQLPNYKNDINAVNARVDNLITAQPQVGELEDIRVDNTGKTWGSAGANVRNIGTLVTNIMDNKALATDDLSDIEDGVFTPELVGTTSGKAVATVAKGQYNKIGNVVNATFVIQLSNKNNIDGFVRITGLPFAVSAAEREIIHLSNLFLYNGFAAPAGTIGVNSFSSRASSQLDLRWAKINGSSAISVNDIQDNFTIYCSIIYRT